ncbi:hypothetical protein HXX76_000656 [Chlamydomonas incerta]|uniref:Uncharacterized protein n=1 Tax=Chlamydomonas incerta TaxID=51695 RepID=A0A835WEI2_CHLIN|nr:hypothetical protein HXX76_000656 [Chlamydomonas incerta]|eukprot:KAG2446054.1 hypothetical protein HXX76_000656 [Chlamydomonas incerta]
MDPSIDSRNEEGVEASAASASATEAIETTAHAPASQPAWGSSSSTDAWLARFSQRVAKHHRENQGLSTGKWRPFVLREALEKAAAELPARTKLGDLVLGKVVALAKWKSRARKLAESHGYKMSTQRPHFQKLREVTARRGAVVGSALEHSGIDPHVDMVMQDSNVDLDKRLEDAAAKHKQTLTPMHVIHARVKFASKGVTRWEAGQQTVMVNAEEETEEETEEEEEGGEEEELEEAHGESQPDPQSRRPWSASDIGGIAEALWQAPPEDSGACSDSDDADRPAPLARSRRASSGSDGGADGVSHGGLWLPSHGGARSQPYDALYDGPYEQAPPQEHQHADAARFRRHRHGSSKQLLAGAADSSSPRQRDASTAAAAAAAGSTHLLGRCSRGGPRSAASSRRASQEGSASTESGGAEEPAETRLGADDSAGVDVAAGHSPRPGALGAPGGSDQEMSDQLGAPPSAATEMALTREVALGSSPVNLPSSGPRDCSSDVKVPPACGAQLDPEPGQAQEALEQRSLAAMATAPAQCCEAGVAGAPDQGHALLLVLPEGALDMDASQQVGREAMAASSELSGASRGWASSVGAASAETAGGMVPSPFGTPLPPDGCSALHPPQLRALGRSISGGTGPCTASSAMSPGGTGLSMPPPSKSNAFVSVAVLDSFPSRNQPVRMPVAAFNGLVGRGVAGVGGAQSPGGAQRSTSPGPASSTNNTGGLPTRTTLSGTLPAPYRPGGDNGSTAEAVVGHALAGGAFAGGVFGGVFGGSGVRGAMSTNGLLTMPMPPQPLSPSPRSGPRQSRTGMGVNVQDIRFGGGGGGGGGRGTAGAPAQGTAGPPGSRQQQQLHPTGAPRTSRRAFRASDGFAAMGGAMAASAAWAGTAVSAEMVAAQRLLPAEVWGATSGGGECAAELLSQQQAQQPQSPHAAAASAPDVPWLVQEGMCDGPACGAEEGHPAAAPLGSPSFSAGGPPVMRLVSYDSADHLPQLLLRASMPSKSKGPGSGTVPSLALPPRLSLTPRASEVGGRTSGPQPSGWPLSPSASPLSPALTSTAANFEPGPLPTDRTQQWQRMQAIAAGQGRSSGALSAGQGPASPSGAPVLAGTTSGKVLGRQQRRLAAGLMGAAAAAAAAATPEGGATAAAAAAAAGASRSAKSFVGMHAEDFDAPRRSSSMGMDYPPHASGELPTPHALASPRTSAYGVNPAAPGWVSGAGAAGNGGHISVRLSCGGASGELLPRLHVEPQLPPAALQLPQHQLQLPSPSSPRHAAHAPASPVGLRQAGCVASPRSPQLLSPHRSTQPPLHPQNHPHGQPSSPGLRLPACSGQQPHPPPAITCQHPPLQQPQQHQHQLRHQHSYPSRLSSSGLSGLCTGGSASSQNHAAAAGLSPPASVSGASPLSPSSSISTVSVTIAPRNYVYGTSCTLPALGVLDSPEALRKAAVDLPDKCKLSDTVFSKILLMMRWRRRAKAQAEARPFTMAARTPHLQRHRQLTARIAAVQDAGLMNTDTLVDMKMEDEATDLGERISAAEEYLERSFTSAADIQRRLRVAMRGVRLWRTGSAGALEQEDLANDTTDEAEEEDEGEGSDLDAAVEDVGNGEGARGAAEAAVAQRADSRLGHAVADLLEAVEDALLLEGGGGGGAELLLAEAGPRSLSMPAMRHPPQHSPPHSGSQTPARDLAGGGGGSNTGTEPAAADDIWALAHFTPATDAGGSPVSALAGRGAGNQRFLHSQLAGQQDVKLPSLRQLEPLPLGQQQHAEQQRRRAGLSAAGPPDPARSGATGGAAAAASPRPPAAVTESLLSLDDAAGVRLVAMAGGSSSMSSRSHGHIQSPATDASASMAREPAAARAHAAGSAGAAGGNAGCSITSPPPRHAAAGTSSGRGGGHLAPQQQQQLAPALPALVPREGAVAGDGGAVGSMGTRGAAAHGTTPAAGLAGQLRAVARGVTDSLSGGGGFTTGAEVEGADVATADAAPMAGPDAARQRMLNWTGHQQPQVGAPRSVWTAAASGAASPAPGGSRSQCSSPSPSAAAARSQASVTQLTFSWAAGLAPSASPATGGGQQTSRLPQQESCSSTCATTVPEGRGTGGSGAAGSSSAQQQQQQQQQLLLPALLSPTAHTSSTHAAGSVLRRHMSSINLDAAASPTGTMRNCGVLTLSASQSYGAQLDSEAQHRMGSPASNQRHRTGGRESPAAAPQATWHATSLALPGSGSNTPVAFEPVGSPSSCVAARDGDSSFGPHGQRRSSLMQLPSPLGGGGGPGLRSGRNSPLPCRSAALSLPSIGSTQSGTDEAPLREDGSSMPSPSSSRHYAARALADRAAQLLSSPPTAAGPRCLGEGGDSPVVAANHSKAMGMTMSAGAGAGAGALTERTGSTRSREGGATITRTRSVGPGAGGGRTWITPPAVVDDASDAAPPSVAGADGSFFRASHAGLGTPGSSPSPSPARMADRNSSSGGGEVPPPASAAGYGDSVRQQLLQAMRAAVAPAGAGAAGVTPGAVAAAGAGPAGAWRPPAEGRPAVCEGAPREPGAAGGAPVSGDPLPALWEVGAEPKPWQQWGLDDVDEVLAPATAPRVAGRQQQPKPPSTARAASMPPAAVSPAASRRRLQATVAQAVVATAAGKIASSSPATRASVPEAADGLPCTDQSAAAAPATRRAAAPQQALDALGALGLVRWGGGGDGGGGGDVSGHNPGAAKLLC